MWYKKLENKRGGFIDKEGNTYCVKECSNVQHPDGRKNAELGYIEFVNMEQCLTAWGLDPITTKDIKNHE